MRASEKREKVGRLIARGMSYSAIAEELGLTKPTVAYHARRLGVPADERAARRYDWAEIQRAYDSGLSVRDCAARFGFSLAAWHAAKRRGVVVARPREAPLASWLVNGRRGNRGHLKARLIKEGLKEDHCERCGIAEWHGDPLSMHLHHVNGDGIDNRLENLELLCPNCHSQTDTYGGRNGHRRKHREPSES